MSILCPFEILTEPGWKQGDTVGVNDRVACVVNNAIEYRAVRQILIYKSNFLFNKFSLSPFELYLCEGRSTPKASTIHPDNILQSFSPIHTDEYDPDPVLQFVGGSVLELEHKQIEAACQGIPLVLEYDNDGGNRLLTMSEDFYNFGTLNKSKSFEKHAVSVSCFENKETSLLIRLATFDRVYKTLCLTV